MKQIFRICDSREEKLSHSTKSSSDGGQELHKMLQIFEEILSERRERSSSMQLAAVFTAGNTFSLRFTAVQKRPRGESFHARGINFFLPAGQRSAEPLPESECRDGILLRHVNFAHQEKSNLTKLRLFFFKWSMKGLLRHSGVSLVYF